MAQRQEPANPPTVAPPLKPKDEMYSRRVTIRVLRMTFVALLMTVTLLYILKTVPGRESVPGSNSGWEQLWYIPLIASAVLAIGAIIFDEFTPKRITVFSGIFFGVLGGLLTTFAFSFVIDLLVEAYDIKKAGSADEIAKLLFAVKVIFGICFCYLGVALVVRTQDDFRLVIPYVEFAKQVRGPKPLVLDSSALIDGRIADVAATGFIQVTLVVPRFVILELQHLGDSSNKLVRARGKRGLEVVTRLQRTKGADTIIDDTPVPGVGVDQMLVELAKILPATIVTADTGLNRVADIHGVSVLNLNDVANALKPSLIPGSRMDITVVKAGEQPGQGVGYLDDGTMVVIDAAADRLGHDLTVEVTSSLQTSAGRMIFARRADAPPRQPATAGVNPESQSPAARVAVDPAAAQLAGDAEGPEAIAEPPVAPGMTPRVVPPPEPPAEQDSGPFPSKRAPRNPFRNPRR